VNPLEQIAAAVLYEGYVLWPYRRSARKNQQRWTFGGVYPRGFVETARSGDKWRVQTQCLVVGDEPEVDIELRFLHIVDRRVALRSVTGELEFVDELQVGTERILAWDEAVERRIPAGLPIAVPAGEEREPVDGGVIVRSWETLSGTCSVSIDVLGAGTRQVTVALENTSAFTSTDRAEAQRRSFISAHFVLRVRNGAFISLTDPPAEHQAAAARCSNVGLWPVLVGAEGDASALLASPIILYDYPQIAPESPGLLFDSGEIDQLLILNTLTLTDAEKAEVRATDPKAREILDRAESLTAQDLSRLHGTIRDFRVLRPDEPFPQLLSEDRHVDTSVSPPLMHFDDDGRLLQLERPTPRSVMVDGAEITAGSVVRLRPRQNADVFDLALAGKVATVESIEQDYDERIHLAVTVHDDPGRDLGMDRMPGHRFFFAPDEVEPIR
jgi:hypothetical protein